MRVYNETGWSTSQLKRLALEVAGRESSLTKVGRARMSVRFWSKASQVYRGMPASPGLVRVKVSSPIIPGEEMVVNRKIELAQTLTWGIGVAVGLRAKDMDGLSKYTFDLNNNTGMWNWVQNFPIAPKEPRLKLEKEVTVEKESSRIVDRRMEVEMATKRLAFWQKRMEMDFYKMKKWQNALKRAEKRLAEVQQTVVLETASSTPKNGRKFRKPERVSA